MGRFYVIFVEQIKEEEEPRPYLSAHVPLTAAVIVPENCEVRGCMEISSECASILIGMLP
jgi:hypothetical protein